MNVKLADRQNQALVILAIATAAIGFGLFGIDLNLQTPTADGTEIVFFIARVVGIFGALGYYAAVLWSSSKLLMREDKITGSELVLGPLISMAAEMVSLAFIFLVDLFT